MKNAASETRFCDFHIAFIFTRYRTLDKLLSFWGLSFFIFTRELVLAPMHRFVGGELTVCRTMTGHIVNHKQEIAFVVNRSST